MLSNDTKWVNSKTGEEAAGLLIIKGSRYPRDITFVTVFTHGFLDLADLKLSTTQWRILCVLLSRLEFGNMVELTQRVIAERLSLQQPTVARAIARLIKLNLLMRQTHPEDARRVIYVLDPHIAWKGKARDWQKFAHHPRHILSKISVGESYEDDIGSRVKLTKNRSRAVK